MPACEERADEPDDIEEREDWKAEMRRRAGGRFGIWSHVGCGSSGKRSDEVEGDVRWAWVSPLVVVVGDGDLGAAEAGVVSDVVWFSGREVIGGFVTRVRERRMTGGGRRARMGFGEVMSPKREDAGEGSGGSSAS